MSKENTDLDLKTLKASYYLLAFDDDAYGHLALPMLSEDLGSSLLLDAGQVSVRTGDAVARVSSPVFGHDTELDRPTLHFDFSDAAGTRYYVVLNFSTDHPLAENCQGLLGRYGTNGEKKAPQEVVGIQRDYFTVFPTRLGPAVKPKSRKDRFPDWKPDFPEAYDDSWREYPFCVGYYSLALTRQHANLIKNANTDVAETIILLSRTSGEQAPLDILLHKPTMITVAYTSGQLQLVLDDNEDGDSIKDSWGDDADDEDNKEEYPLFFNILLDDVANTLRGVLRTTHSKEDEFYLWTGALVPFQKPSLSDQMKNV